jgi:endonuclease YncB( thermonuclease family)
MLKELLLSAAISLSAVDGDTIKVDGDTYRLVGLDTPELFSGKCVAERRLASKARLRLIELMKTPNARMQEVLCHGSNFGRKCAVVYVNERNVASYMVREGYADEYYCTSSGCPKRRNWCSYATNMERKAK